MATNSSIINAVKVWIFPGVISLLAGSIWYDLKEVKADVKQLMILTNVNQTKITDLERRVNNLETTVYMKPNAQRTVLLGPMPSRYFLKEEELDINKYLRKKV